MPDTTTLLFAALIAGLVMSAGLVLIGFAQGLMRGQSFSHYLHRHYSASDIGRILSEPVYQR